MEKICKKCHRELPLEKFYTRPSRRDGYDSQCKDCVNQRVSKWVKDNPEWVKKKQKRTAENRLAHGLCRHCTSIRLPNHNRFCEKHYITNVARVAIGSASNEAYRILLDKLNEQNWKCPYTGEQLVLGKNTHLDHIYPIAHFPKLRYNIDNVEWVSTRINLAKRDLTKQEFIELCQVVCSNL